VFPAESGDAEIEGRIVDEDEHIRALREEGLLRQAEVTAYLSRVFDHFHITHISHKAYMLDKTNSGGGHPVAAESYEKRFGITLTNLLHERSSVCIP
jgi:hypothetical protein